MSHTNKIIDADPHFSIDTITRRIQNKSSEKVTLIQGDHNSERFTFDLPRYIEQHDMLECNRVEVHFNNNGYEDVYDVVDMQTHPDNSEKIAFSWLLTGNATKNEGKLEFAIRMACVDDDGTVEYEWNTAICSIITVTKGLNNSKAVTEPFPDILAQWANRIFGESGDAVENINSAKAAAIAEILGKTGEFATLKDLEADFRTLSGEIGTQVSRLEAGLFVVKKAECDSNGNKIDETYETKENVKIHAENNKTHIVEHKFTNKNLYYFRDAPELDSMTAGIYILHNTGMATGFLFCGHGNNPDEADTQILLEVDGNLYRRTCFAEYSEDGRTYTMKWTAWDGYTTKKFVESAIGDVETSLENIIKKYGLGGDAV